MEFPELRKPEPQSPPPKSHIPGTITRYFDNAVLAVGGEPLLRTSSGQVIRREGRDYVIDHEVR